MYIIHMKNSNNYLFCLIFCDGKYISTSVEQHGWSAWVVSMGAHTCGANYNKVTEMHLYSPSSNNMSYL